LAIASNNSTPSIVAINQVPTSVTEYTKATQDDVINSFQKRDVCSGGYSSKGVNSNDESKPAEFIKLNKLTLSQDFEPFGYREDRHDERPEWAGACREEEQIH
jgi:hypothetical protein